MRSSTTTQYFISAKDIDQGAELLTKDEIKTQFEPVEGTVSLAKAIDYPYKLKYLVRDSDPYNPRTEYDHAGKMVCFHKRYNLGDKHRYSKENFSSWKELMEVVEKDAGKFIAVLPLYLFDHSGITMSTTSGRFRMCDTAGWDWGQVGFIYMTEEDAKKCWGIAEVTDQLKKQAEDCLIAEVEEYDHYLTGEVYGTIVEFLNESFEQINQDSYWGYFGLKYAKEALTEL